MENYRVSLRLVRVSISCHNYFVIRLPFILCTIAVLLLSAGGALSSDFQNGRDAYDRDDYATALREWVPLAKQGNSDAQFFLGVMYQKGLGVPKNSVVSMKWYRLAAEQGDADAQYEMGRLYHHGIEHRGTTLGYKIRRNKLAVKWYRMAAAQGNNSARKLAVRLENWIAQQTGKVISKKSPTVEIAIKPNPKPTPPTKSSTSGSGFFVSKLGHLVTNEHVVKSCKNLTVGDNSKTQVRAVVVETDRRNDLALLKISSTEMASAETKSLIRKLGSTLTSNLGLKVVPLSSNGLLRSDDVELGESLLVAGYPYGEIFSNTIKVTKGIVSAIRGIGDDSGQFQLDAAVQPGNSGGPIYDENGNIVGVVVAQLNKLKFAKTIGSLPENVNFGIKASTVRQFLTSAGLPTKWSSRTNSMSTRDLAKIAKNQTVMVVCHR